jgi:uncharacterized protein
MDTNLLNQEFHKAIKNNDLTKLEDLIVSYPDQLNELTVFGNWLHVAISFQASLDVVECLVAHRININQEAGIGRGNPLNLAASKGRIDIVNYLLNNGALIDVSEPERNPLFSAIYAGNMEIAKNLLSHGMDFRIKYSGERMNDMDALSFAKERGQTEIAEMISHLI